MSYIIPAAVVAVAAAALAACTDRTPRPEKGEYDQMRREMVDLIADYSSEHKVRDPRVLAAMFKVPRHEFVPEELRHLAYSDRPLDIGEGQTISQPFMVGFMTELLQLKPTDKVLEIGTGSGYQAAILAELARKVYTVEIVPTLARRAEETLRRLGYGNVAVRVGDGYKGWPEHAPFDAAIVTCAPDHIPKPIVDQLREGGRLVIPVGLESGLLAGQDLILARKTKTGLSQQIRMDVRFVPMTGEARRPKP
ncbi:MAG TPA: protein-L-isoaspartate(D-aspartate) O-methyltransferase [Elusimicrobia bacterium]|nr:protein-L-isoaspartate(D-aspartate) O-methyltransferase [Elusimicrobiota bacterium]HBT61620.1 protein-L-isoaspartate(D-aspartate) O-methyltransferase [Elusimicrobiota bacterium]